MNSMNPIRCKDNSITIIDPRIVEETKIQGIVKNIPGMNSSINNDEFSDLLETFVLEKNQEALKNVLYLLHQPSEDIKKCFANLNPYFTWEANIRDEIIYQEDFDLLHAIFPAFSEAVKTDARAFQACIQSGNERNIKKLLHIGFTYSPNHEHFQELMDAISHHHLDGLTHVIPGAKINLNQVYKYCFESVTYATTPLYQAVRMGYSQMVRRLISLGADCNLQNHPPDPAYAKFRDLDLDYDNALTGAIRLGDQDCFDAILEESKNLNVNIRVKYNSTPLIIAAKNKQWSMVRTLIDKKADVNMQDKACHTPLFWTIYHGNSSLATSLLEAGANKDWINQYGDNLWHIFAMSSEAVPGMGILLIENGIHEFNKINEFGETPLAKAILLRNARGVCNLLLCGVNSTQKIKVNDEEITYQELTQKKLTEKGLSKEQTSQLEQIQNLLNEFSNK